VAHSLRRILKPLGIEFFQDEVTDVDFEARRVKTGGGDYSYDYLVLAPGGRTVSFGTQGAPGSSARDYDAVGVPFVERWKRLDEAVKALRALWHADGPPYGGEFDSTKNILLELRQSQQSCPPTWIGSWGFRGRPSQDSPPGRRLASAYNTTPEAFADVRARRGEYLRASGKDPDRSPNAFAAVFFHVTEDRAEVDRICRDVLGPTLRRPGEEL